MIGTRSQSLWRASGEGFTGLAHIAVRVLVANGVLVLCSKVAIPLPWTPVPVTLQSFGVLLIAVLFGARASALAALVYLVEGAAGLPVFQPYGVPAASRLFGPTAGYLLAFPVAAFLAGWLVEWVSARTSISRSGAPGWLALAAALLPGSAVILLCGWAWLTAFVGAANAAKLGVAPFLAGELLKLSAATGVARVWHSNR